MKPLLQRPTPVFDPARGLLNNEHFQMAYVTSDLARATEVFSERFGIGEFRHIGGEMPSGGHIDVKLAWVGSIMYELIHCRGPGSEMYMKELPAEGFAIRHHHLGYLVHDDSAWDKLLATIEHGGWRITQINDNQGFMKHCYVHVPELGHYFEYIFPEKTGIEFFEQVPAF